MPGKQLLRDTQRGEKPGISCKPCRGGQNITLEGATKKNFIEGFDEEHKIENIIFDQIRINGKMI